MGFRSASIFLFALPQLSWAAAAPNLVLITIDTLRADHVGAYGYGRARTSALDSLARTGVLFERAYAAAPITLTSHATMLTGRYPPGHGARDNGMAMRPVPTLATELHAHGFKTGAFVAAFPLDHEFGLNRGFDVYGDRLGRDSAGRPANERPAAQVVDEAIAWLHSLTAPPAPPAQPAPPAPRYFLWVHLFEPHAPYGVDLSRPALERYDDEIETADRAVGRIVQALGPRTDTLIVVAGDHGEAFGEHGEYAHSIFVYDTTLRVPLIIAGTGQTRSVPDRVTLADLAPTAMRLLGFTMSDVDGVDLSPAFRGGALAARELYAESFAPLVEFGWAPLRAIRSGPWKFIAAPQPELFDIERDPAEQINRVSAEESISQSLSDRANRYSNPAFPTGAAQQSDPQALDRLRALGYSAGSTSQSQPTTARPDPKERRDLAARLAQVMSGELQGEALTAALERIVRDDPRNGQAHLRLGYARLQAGDCKRAEPEFHAAAGSGLPSADIYLGLATCMGRRGDLAGAEHALGEARRLEPDNPVIVANIGILQATRGDLPAAIESLKKALIADPTLDEARFNLAVACAKAGRRNEAAETARMLLARLPPNAPQRAEVERLLRSVQ
jgi:arylsulfatase A-like enzyme/Flp pilus assembly protein TadD